MLTMFTNTNELSGPLAGGKLRQKPIKLKGIAARHPRSGTAFLILRESV